MTVQVVMEAAHQQSVADTHQFVQTVQVHIVLSQILQQEVLRYFCFIHIV